VSHPCGCVSESRRNGFRLSHLACLATLPPRKRARRAGVQAVAGRRLAAMADKASHLAAAALVTNQSAIVRLLKHWMIHGKPRQNSKKSWPEKWRMTPTN